MNVSIVIPVKNGAGTLQRCLDSMRNQITPPGEIIIINSESSDNSKEVALKFDAQVIDISESEFDHGLTRNLGIAHCSGDLIFFTVQDAWIADNDMLEKMAAHFQDPQVMAVTGHQAVPHEMDKNPMRWYRRYSEHAVDVRQLTDVEAFKNLSQSAQQKLIAWDNVVAMYRKSALIELPFVQTEMSEDWMWSYQALLKGWKLIRDSSLVVYHYHHATIEYNFRTAYSINYHFYKFFGFKPQLPPVIKPNIKAAYHLFRNKELTFRKKLYWSLHNLMSGIATWFSNFDFLRVLKLQGEKGIEKAYKKYCRQIPQGKQKGSRLAMKEQ